MWPPPSGPTSPATRPPTSGSTVTAIRICRAKEAPSESSRRVRSRPSIWLRVKSSATAMIAVPWCRVTGRLEESHARWLGGRSSTSSRQTSSSCGSAGSPAARSVGSFAGPPSSWPEASLSSSTRVSPLPSVSADRVGGDPVQCSGPTCRTAVGPASGVQRGRGAHGPHVCPQVVHAAGQPSTSRTAEQLPDVLCVGAGAGTRCVSAQGDGRGEPRGPAHATSPVTAEASGCPQACRFDPVSGHRVPLGGRTGVDRCRRVRVRAVSSRPAADRTPFAPRPRTTLATPPETCREQAHLPAEQPSSPQGARLPPADAHPCRAGHPVRASAQGPRQARRLSRLGAAPAWCHR